MKIVEYAKDGNLNGVKQELLNGADVNSIDVKAKATPLFVASLFGHIDVVNYLLKFGADVNISNVDKETPLFRAAHYDYMEIVKLLIENGADINHKATHKSTVLMTTCWSKKTEMIRFLIEHGADTNAVSTQGWTAFIYACESDDLPTAKVLLPLSNINHQNKYGWTALMIVAEKGFYEMAYFLIQNGANINIIDQEFSRTALMRAAEKGQFDLVKLFVENGADIGIVNSKGQTVIDTCKRHQKIYKFLQAQ